MLTLRHLVEERDGLFSVCAEEAPMLSYYANSIVHLLPAKEEEAPAHGAAAG
jgi:hypothetical protein